MAVERGVTKFFGGAATTAALLLLLSVPCAAQESSGLEDARWAFVEGGAHFEARRYDQALAAFQHSYSRVQSPNTLLMVARCERELGRRADAAVTFERAAQEAKRRAAAGESKYAPTAQAATDEGQRLRSTLGALRIHVEGAGGVLKADGKPIPLSPAGEAFVLREPGTATVELITENGARQRQTISVAAGSTVSMAFGAEAVAPITEVAPPRAPSRVGDSRRTWTTPAAIVSSALTLAGTGTFIGFGLSSQHTYDRLDARCGPRQCGPSDRAEADRGARAQVIANVGLGVALTAAVATVVFVVLAIESSSGSTRVDVSSGAPAILW